MAHARTAIETELMVRLNAVAGVTTVSDHIAQGLSIAANQNTTDLPALVLWFVEEMAQAESMAGTGLDADVEVERMAKYWVFALHTTKALCDSLCADVEAAFAALPPSGEWRFLHLDGTDTNAEDFVGKHFYHQRLTFSCEYVTTRDTPGTAV